MAGGGGGTAAHAVFADVALPLAVDQPFTYAVPQALQERVAVGMRALVPIQRRLDTGYIVGLSDNSLLESVKEVVDVLDEEPVISEEMMALCQWVAEYYCCSLGEACQCAIPSGINLASRMRYRLVPDGLTTGRYSNTQRQIVAALHRAGPLTESELEQATGETTLRTHIRSLERRGVVLAEPVVIKSSVRPRTESWVSLVEDAALSVPDQIALQRRSPRQAAIYLDLLHGAPARPTAELLAKHGGTTSVLNALERKGLIAREDREIYRAPQFHADDRARRKHQLNADQQSAFDALTAAIDLRAFQTFLLQGITGSGKTEVYLQTIEHALQQGLNAIVLVPEISLTPQTVGRFMGRFDTHIAVLHSGLSPGERYDEWRRVQRGEVRIVVGARSAVFAPLSDLGVIIVDEEHDGSYKQADVPRYHARDVAIMRAKLNDAVCVLGSATPSIETYYNSENGKSVRLELRERATTATLPEVQVVDMRHEIRELGGEIVLSRLLEAEIQARVDAKEQVILLLNRRGHSPFVLCPQCGWCAQCTDCHVSLTFHTARSGRGGANDYLSCHYCNGRRAVPQACEECAFHPLIYLGVGTQKIEDLLARTFTGARVERMDRDTTSGKTRHAQILNRFSRGEIDILVGTQMIAKGHDYPGVTLVGVINADTGLGLPDFRAAESSFQLLTQVAGRAGRGHKPGTVIVQTFRPKHYAVQAATQHDFAAFYEHEIEQRREAAYPPFRRMLSMAVESEDLVEAERSAALLHRIASEQIDALEFQGIQLLGPAPASIRRLKKKYRWNLGAFSRSAKRLNALARAVRDDFARRAPRSVQLKIDLDPYGLF